MAEILIKAVDATHPDPVKDKRGCYKKGDPVVVMPNGHNWGNAECLPTFYVFRIPGLTVEEARQYIEPAYILGNPELGISERRKFRFPFWDKIPVDVRDSIKASNWKLIDISPADIQVKA